MHSDDIRQDLYYFVLGMTVDAYLASGQFVVPDTSAPSGEKSDMMDMKRVRGNVDHMMANIERAVVQGKTNYGARSDLECVIETEAKKLFRPHVSALTANTSKEV